MNVRAFFRHCSSLRRYYRNQARVTYTRDPPNFENFTLLGRGRGADLKRSARREPRSRGPTHARLAASFRCATRESCAMRFPFPVPSVDRRLEVRCIPPFQGVCYTLRPSAFHSTQTV